MYQSFEKLNRVQQLPSDSGTLVGRALSQRPIDLLQSVYDLLDALVAAVLTGLH